MSLQDLVWQYYDSKHSVTACQAYFDDSENSEKLMVAYESILPIIGIVIRKDFSHLQEADLDDLMQAGAIEYWRYLSEKKPHPYDTRSHFNLYYKIGFHAMIKAKGMNAPVVVDFFYNGALPPAASCNFQPSDQKLFARQLPKMVFDLIVPKIRFTGAEFEVCKYIAHCLVFEEPIRRFQIRQIGGRITNAEFFEMYVSVLKECALLEIRETTKLGDLLGDEGAALDPSYYYVQDQSYPAGSSGTRRVHHHH